MSARQPEAAASRQQWVSRPAPALREWVSHYWLSLDNTSLAHGILPDGTVDWVVSVAPSACRIEVFGTTTTRTEVALETGASYLGIRFHPGQSRHFVDAPAALLVDACVPAADVSRLRLDPVADLLPGGDPCATLDTLLMRHLDRHPPRPLALDTAVQRLAAGRTGARLTDLAHACGFSLRQFERLFRDAVGLSPRLFAEIARFQRAAHWLARTDLPLAEIAAALDYADQSHLTRAFTRFAGQPPARARRDVAFVQDPTRAPGETVNAFNNLMEYPK